MISILSWRIVKATPLWWNSLCPREKTAQPTCSSWEFENTWFEGFWDLRGICPTRSCSCIFFFFFERISTFLIYIFRNHGIRKGLRSFSHVGSLHVINLLMKSKSRSSLRLGCAGKTSVLQLQVTWVWVWVLIFRPEATPHLQPWCHGFLWCCEPTH